MLWKERVQRHWTAVEKSSSTNSTPLDIPTRKENIDVHKTLHINIHTCITDHLTHHLKMESGQAWWLKPVILPTWEAEIGRIVVWGQLE
jgi:hypothetical protein